MTFLLQPATLADFDTISTYTTAASGDLVAPAKQVCWTTPCPARSQWSANVERHMFQHDESMRFIKVVDSGTSEIVSWGRWEVYQDGFPAAGYDFAAEEAIGWPEEGLNVKLYQELLVEIFGKRRSWMGAGKQWILSTIVTREPFRKQGAGGLIVNWGVEQARKDDCPAYLEAVADAISLYESHGFKVVEKFAHDMSKYELPNITFARMAANKI